MHHRDINVLSPSVSYLSTSCTKQTISPALMKASHTQLRVGGQDGFVMTAVPGSLTWRSKVQWVCLYRPRRSPAECNGHSEPFPVFTWFTSRLHGVNAHTLEWVWMNASPLLWQGPNNALHVYNRNKLYIWVLWKLMMYENSGWGAFRPLKVQYSCCSITSIQSGLSWMVLQKFNLNTF